ncbi:hypothetical protein BKG94_01665 [Rodentibacter ratti]|uniref:O-antigen ligase family protein n=1 Tax=Rodentibacter ratti TaxID=1906745 RepID=UPI0009870D83|nr:O-antigen ligase family protein [Rodentibacter ratti]OOF89329.1 hypothetical protein BKG94_01665 [Rodentibacter ratti]
MKVAIVSVFYIFFISILFFLRKNKSDIFYIGMPLVLITGFLIPFSDEVYNIVLDDIKFSINSITLYLAFLFFILIDFRKFKYNNFIFFCLFIFLITPLINLINGEIYNNPRFLNVYLIDVSIFFCLAIIINFQNLNLNKLMGLFYFISIFNGVISILQMITKKALNFNNWNTSILYTEGIVDSYRAVGVAGSNNSAGNLGAILFTICFYGYINSKNKYAALGSILSLVAIALSQTRIAMLAIIILMFYFLFSCFIENRLRMKKSTLLFFILFFIIAFIVFIFFLDKIYQILFLDRGNTESSRFIQFDIAITYGVLKNIWLGVGVGQWQSYIYNLNNYVDLYIHSQYLSVLTEQGIFSFLAFIFFNLYLLFKIRNSDFVDIKLKKFATMLFLVNFIICNANPNQMYLITNVIYYLLMASLYMLNKGNTKYETIK